MLPTLYASAKPHRSSTGMPQRRIKNPILASYSISQSKELLLPSSGSRKTSTNCHILGEAARGAEHRIVLRANLYTGKNPACRARRSHEVNVESLWPYHKACLWEIKFNKEL